ncbi:hypothetical protein GGQ84_001612 [Desulfitispora alkaliphila]|uniref:hypothetical protein n=1 Tax=Desulfitispora alkaliphila TaxID=622674 RepID=UPI003D1E510C
MKDNMTENCHKMLNSLILKSRHFCKYAAPDALGDILMVYLSSGKVPDELLFSKKLSYDYDYFAFTKSTKSLMAIKCLLNDDKYFFNEDCFMLIRSIFECHIMSRYIREHIDIENERENVIKKFIVNPLSVTFNHYTLQGYNIFDTSGNKVGSIPMPNNFIAGNDKLYYSDFYQFLCQYTHCSFGALTCYYGEKQFTYSKNNFSLLTLLFSLFVFTKIYEGVVTVKGEDLGDTKEEKIFYDLAYDSLELQNRLFDYLIDYYEKKPQEEVNRILEKYLGDGSYDGTDKKIANMLANMKASLLDSEIGSLNKSVFEYGQFKRFYPSWN